MSFVIIRRLIYYCYYVIVTGMVMRLSVIVCHAPILYTVIAFRWFCGCYVAHAMVIYHIIFIIITPYAIILRHYWLFTLLRYQYTNVAAIHCFHC